jgi:putative phosphoesterase
MNFNTVDADTALVLSDTHLHDASRIPASVFALAEQAGLIIHAGDHSTLEVISVLGQFAPVASVHGNIDDAEVVAALPARLDLDAGPLGMIGVTHDPGPADGRERRLKSWFPNAATIIYGHTHSPEVVSSDGVLIINPGSPTQRRRAPTHTVAWLDLDPRARPRARLIDV